MLDIVSFNKSFAGVFRDLNIAWLEEYFIVEEQDLVLLNDSQAQILDKGGFIFIGLWNTVPVSCFALIANENGFFELGKMAVDKNYQGKKIGQGLLTYAIQFAKANNWKKIILYSSTKLDTALHIYHKFGFKEVPLEKELPYVRSDVKMELTL